jgi:hypothetical protein
MREPGYAGMRDNAVAGPVAGYWMVQFPTGMALLAVDMTPSGPNAPCSSHAMVARRLDHATARLVSRTRLLRRSLEPNGVTSNSVPEHA